MSEGPRKLAVLPRPRSHWQAIDAGMLLARAHYWKLLVLWLTFSVPIAAIVLILTLSGFTNIWVILIMWWFKPLYELPLLMYLSNVLFSQPTSIRQALKESKRQFFALFKSYLTLSRISPSRSMTAPVVFLEQLKGKARRKRVATLTNDTTRAYTLMLAWLHIEGIGFYVLMPILYTLLGAGVTLEQFWSDFGETDTAYGTIPLVLFAVVPMILSALAGPFYVSSGFLLYINRRMRLEAWDIEHQFHDLESRHRQRGSSSILASYITPITLATTLALISAMSLAPTSTAVAQEARNLAPIESIRESVKSVYKSEDFGSSKTVESLRFKESKSKAGSDNDLNLAWIVNALEYLFSISRIIVYVLAGACVAILIWALLKFMPDSWQLSKRRPTLELLDVEHHPLTKSLPTDIKAAATMALQQGNHREAISLLYRGALRTVMLRHSLSIPKSATERECEHWVAKCNVEEQTKSFNQIVGRWTGIAYANLQPTAEETSNLIEFWASKFSSGTSTEVTQ